MKLGYTFPFALLVALSSTACQSARAPAAPPVTSTTTLSAAQLKAPPHVGKGQMSREADPAASPKEPHRSSSSRGGTFGEWK